MRLVEGGDYFSLCFPSLHSYFSAGWDLSPTDQVSLQGGTHRSLIRFLFGVRYLTFELN